MLITVRTGPSALETMYCKTERDAQGNLMAFHMGRYFPVDPEGGIDLMGSSLTADELVMAAAPSHAAIIEGEFETYVFLSAPSVELERLVHRLRTAGAQILREGRYLGAPVESFQPDWLIKIATPEAGFGSLGVDVPPPAATSPTTQDASEVRLRLLSETNARLSAEVRALRASQAKALPAAAPPPEIAPVALPPVTASEPEPVPTAIEARPQASPSASSRHKVIMREVQSILSAVFPHLEPLRASMERLAIEATDRRAFYSALRELDEPRLGSNWKKLKGLDGWFERHVSDGRSDAGRIYARHYDSGWQILFGNKGEQATDIAWLSRQ